MARRCFWVTVLAGVAATTYAWFDLPDRVPMHFGGAGSVDGWGTRTEAVVTMGALVGGTALLFWLLATWVPRMPESLLNLPGKDKEWWLATPERRTELDARLAADLHGLGGATILLVVVAELFTVRAAHQDVPGLGAWFWVVVALYLVVILGYSGYMLAVRYRRPRDADGG